MCVSELYCWVSSLYWMNPTRFLRPTWTLLSCTANGETVKEKTGNTQRSLGNKWLHKNTEYGLFKCLFNDYLFNACYILMALLEGMVLNNTLANGKPLYKDFDLFSGSAVPSCGWMSHWNTSDCLSPLGKLFCMLQFMFLTIWVGTFDLHQISSLRTSVVYFSALAS